LSPYKNKKSGYNLAMKKFLIALLIIAAAAIGAATLGGGAGGMRDGENYLRVHIRANSNAATDQEVKYKVRDAVTDYLTPKIAYCDTFGQAIELISGECGNIETVADRVLRENGYSYTSAAAVLNEKFPTRSYDGFVLESGLYDALIIKLGTGEGDNWWCVVYPPLCFVGGESNGTNRIRYKSKILEIIENFKRRAA
jgi:stage II sporulation protein R